MKKIIGIVLPTSIPIAISKIDNSGTIIKGSDGISLPFSLPASIGKAGSKSSGGATTKSPLKISVQEIAQQIGALTFPVSEQAWHFKGIILEECIVDTMHSNFIVYEDIRSRILTEIHLIDKNHLSIKWYGQEVNEVMILRKSALDDKYEVIATVPWDTGEYILEVSEDATNAKLEGVGATGESSVISLEDGFTTEIRTNFEVAINTKVHYLESNSDSVFRLKVNY